MMFKVIKISTGKIVDVYDVKMAEGQTALFLTYEYEGWAFRPASRFRPATEEDRKKEFLEKLKNMSTVLQPAPPPVQIIGPDPDLGQALRKAAEEGQDERLEGLCAFGPLTRMDEGDER
jgi:hypothetical protein